MGNCAKQSNFRLKEIVHAVAVENIAQSKAMMAIWSQATVSGAARLK
jgi:hypothetical protein